MGAVFRFSQVGNDFDIHFTLIGGKVSIFPLAFCASNHIRETTDRERKPEAKTGRGKWQMKERG